jgi:hypothetical protein
MIAIIVNRLIMIVPCYTCLKLRSSLLVQTFKEHCFSFTTYSSPTIHDHRTPHKHPYAIIHEAITSTRS